MGFIYAKNTFLLLDQLLSIRFLTMLEWCGPFDFARKQAHFHKLITVALKFIKLVHSLTLYFSRSLSPLVVCSYSKSKLSALLCLDSLSLWAGLG